MPATRLNLGCGRKRIEDAVNVDVAKSVGPDVLCDLNRRPWPFTDDRFREVFAYDDVVATMEEIHRISGNGAILRITVPHFSCANTFTDPTHRHQFGWSSFDYFTGEHELSFYSAATFRRRASRIVSFPTFVNKIVWRLANRHPEAYERRWAWMFPAWFLYFELEVVKRPA